VTDAQAQEMVGLLTKMEASLASRVGSIGDERMPSTQVFSRVEGLSRRFNDVVERLCEVVITRHDAQVVAGKLDSILLEMRKHTLVLESICSKINDATAPKGKRKS
jgi:hypothetical protein